MSSAGRLFHQDSDWCGKNSCILVLTPSLITPHRLGSPFSSALAASFICSKVACGGIGGTSGSVRASIPGDLVEVVVVQDGDDQPWVGPLVPVVLDGDQLGEAVHLHRAVSGED